MERCRAIAFLKRCQDFHGRARLRPSRNDQNDCSSLRGSAGAPPFQTPPNLKNAFALRKDVRLGADGWQADKSTFSTPAGRRADSAITLEVTDDIANDTNRFEHLLA